MMNVASSAVRDEDLEPLRRFMVGDPGGVDVFEGEPEDTAVQAAWRMFVAASAVAVRWKFGELFTRKAIIEYVAELRISMGEDRNDLDPKAAEDWIRNAVDNLPLEEQVRLPRHADALVFAIFFVLERLRDENIVGEAGLDAFLRATMNFAKEIEERLPAIWDEVGPLIEAQLPKDGDPTAS